MASFPFSHNAFSINNGYLHLPNKLSVGFHRLNPVSMENHAAFGHEKLTDIEIVFLFKVFGVSSVFFVGGWISLRVSYGSVVLSMLYQWIIHGWVHMI